MENMPLIDRLQLANEILGEVADLATSLPEHKDDAATMVAQMILTRSYLTELALNLVRGKETYDAVLVTARGLTPIA